MKITRWVIVAAISVACMWVASAYTPIGSSQSSMENEIKTLEKTHAQEISQVFLREMRPGFNRYSKVWIFGELLDTWGSNEEEAQEGGNWWVTTVYEAELLMMYWSKFNKKELPELAISDYMSYSKKVFWTYFNEGIYTVVLRDWRMLQYGQKWVFLTISRLFEWKWKFVKSDVAATMPEEESETIVYSWEEVSLTNLPVLAVVDITRFDSSFRTAYYDSDDGIYTVYLSNWTILTYGTQWVFLSIQ